MRRLLFLTLFALLACGAARAQEKIAITLAQGSRDEARTKEQLGRLLARYDLSKWIFTRAVVIDEKTRIPHSHPKLTLNTRHLLDDELLLSTFVHEQAHWLLVQRDKDTEEAIKELRVMFPKVPAGGPEGARDERSSYLHLVVIYLEYRALRELLGELRARQVMEFWAHDHYTWIYKTVLDRPRDIGNVAFKHKLVPTERTQ
ncbi:MAG TPA: hypothetical protein VK421_15740 [Pyrinomonadaceae bacterium]|nr:hypothetical protein [Pyrinomonadaceae bacterium]